MSSVPPDTEIPVPPHIAELSRFRDDRKTLSFMLLGGETQLGMVRWFDDQAIHIVTPDREEMTLFRHAILYYRKV
jgi:hypothetical protein